MQIKYSVIIPVYNAERTLKRCLDSLLSQQRMDVEIILINDGSSDRSAEIIGDFKTRFRNIKALTQENSGVSSARNSGLDAQGELILRLWTVTTMFQKIIFKRWTRLAQERTVI